MEYYDEYISLGGNCEIGFQFRRYGKNSSSLFTWLVSNIDIITQAIKTDFENFYEFEDLIPYAHDMVKSTTSGFSFHSKIASKYNVETKKMEFIQSEKERRKIAKNEREKYLYFIQKWHTLSKSNQKVVYFIKDTFSYTEEQLIKLESTILDKNPNHKFKLVVIREGIVGRQKKLTPYTDICYVNFFSDKKYPAVQILDLKAWDKIFSFYTLKQPLSESLEWIKYECNFSKNNDYSLALNFNLSQFYEKVNFLENAHYFISLAKKQSSESFVHAEYLRITDKLLAQNKKEEERTQEHIQKIYSFYSEEEINNYLINNNLLAWRYDNKPLVIDVYNQVRYIRISLQEKMCLHLDEIEVLNIKDENIALNKSLIMSSTYKSKKPMVNKKASNGIVSGKPSFHTKTEENPWVLLDLEDYEQVKSIKLFNRAGKYSTRALSLLVESSSNLKDWDILFDNYKIFKKLDNRCLTSEQQNILNKIKDSSLEIFKININLIAELKNLLKIADENKNSDTYSIIKYTLLLKFKAYYQIKVDIKKSNNIKNELLLVNYAVEICNGKGFVFTLEKGLVKKNFEESQMLILSDIDDIKKNLLDFLYMIDLYDINSEEISIVKYAILSKYKAISRLTGELKQSSNKIMTNNQIIKGIELIYGKGYVLTQHGIKKNIDTVYTLEDKVKIVEALNKFFNILKEKLNIDTYITSGTLLGAVRNNEFISYDDDFDTAYISNETNSPNIWLETLQICKVLPFKINPIVGGLLHVKIDLDLVFKVDLFTGWIKDGYFNRYPVPINVLIQEDILPLKKITLHGERINVPNNVEAILENNYGKNWKTPDPTWRFDWKTANESYKDLLFSLKEEELPSKELFTKDLPFLVNSILENTEYTTIYSEDKSIIQMELLLFVEHSKEDSLLFFNAYFIDDLDVQHKVFIEFVQANPQYTLRYVGKINSGVLIKFKNILKD